MNDEARVKETALTLPLLKSLEQATSLSCGTDPSALEAYFAVCHVSDSFADFINSLTNTAFWRTKRPGGGDLPELCGQFALAVDEYAGQQAEPAYHSRRHFKEVCLALSLLLRAGQDLPVAGAAPNPWALTDENCWILLLAAMAHDFGHEGRPNRSAGELEEKACVLVARFRAAHPKLSQNALDTIQELIRATEPTLFATLMAAASQQALQPIDVMKVLLIEADLFASMLPNYGMTLSVLLAQEFEPHAPALAKRIDSPEGRQGFLDTHPYVSPNSQRLGFNDLIHQSVIQTQH